MRPEDVPQEIVDLFNDRAGKLHRRDGQAIVTLAEILTLYDELKIPEDSTPLCGVCDILHDPPLHYDG